MSSILPRFFKLSVFLALACSLGGCVVMPKQSRSLILDDRGFRIDVTECRALGTPSKKSLILLPPTGGTNLIDRSYLKTFCKNGYDVYLINDWSRPGEVGSDLEFHQRAYTNSQRAIGFVLKQIKTPFIGLMGTSVGATHAEVAANTFAEIDAAFFIVGGLPIPEVIVTSDHSSMLKFKRERQEMFKFANDQAYEQAIQNVFKFEPTRLGDLHLKKDFGAVISTADTTVAYETQEKLVEFFKPRKVIKLQSSHFMAVVNTWLSHTNELVSFFDESATRKIESTHSR